MGLPGLRSRQARAKKELEKAEAIAEIKRERQCSGGAARGLLGQGIHGWKSSL